MKKKSVAHDGVKIRGFARVQIWDHGPEGEPFHKLHSDTGWVGPNQKTTIGMYNFFNLLLGQSAGSLPINAACLGTGGTPASNGASLPGYVTFMPTTFQTNASTAPQWIASYSSAAASFSIGNVGLFNSSQTGSLCCGISTPTQTWLTNQSCAVTYQLQMAIGT